VVSKLVADVPGHARNVDPELVNAWGIAASPTGPWWTSNEARESSTLYSGAGRKQLLTVTVEGGPTGVAYYGGKSFLVSAGHASDPARFIYACEDGKLRAWTPTVPTGWSTRTESRSTRAARRRCSRCLVGGRVSPRTSQRSGRRLRQRLAADPSPACIQTSRSVVVRKIRRAGDRVTCS
jgi:hypothetical protein